jgi:ABC-2 type transport system permease protein
MTDPTPQPVPVDVFADGEARILDRGFRHYQGPRLRWQPLRTVVLHGIQRGLGFRRSTSAKVLPFIAVAIAFLPAIVMVGLAAMVRGAVTIELELPTYSEYFSSISLAILMLTALVAPEVFGNDQRTGMLGIYLASPLTRTGYLVAKSLSVAAILLLITAGPQLLLLVAATVQGVGPEDIVDWLVVFVRIIASGVVVSALLTAVSVAVTVVTNNKGMAIAGIAVLLLVVTGIASSMAEVSGAEAWQVFSVLQVLFSLPPTIHGEAFDSSDRLSLGVAWTGWAFWTGGGALVAWYRLQRLEITR